MADPSLPDSQPTADGSTPVVDPLTPAERKRIQQLFEHGKQRASKEQHDYAHEMFAQCVRKDPSNLIYVEALLDNLQAKFNNDKKGGKGRINRGPIKKAVSKEQWDGVLDLGLDALKENPWDVSSLRAMATACAAMHFNEVELRYLKNALDANPKDPDVNRHCAESLARMGQFDQAIACWHRVEELVRGDREAPKKISELTLAKAHHIGGIGMEDDETSGEKSGAPRSGTAGKSTAKGAKDTQGPPSKPTTRGETTLPPARRPGADPVPEGENSDDPIKDNSSGPSAPTREQLQRAIADDPTDISPYLKLAKILTAEKKYKDAERVLMRAMAASGNDLKVGEQLEQAQIRRRRHQLAVAEQRAAHEKSDSARSLVRQMRADLNRLELQIYSQRHERYPEDVTIQYELGIRLKRVENYAEAAKMLEQAAMDPRFQIAATLERGECLQHMRQYQEAMQCYRETVRLTESGREGQLKWRKMALYRAAVLAGGLKATEEARQLFSQLVQLEPGFKDAQSRLDKLIDVGQN